MESIVRKNNIENHLERLVDLNERILNQLSNIHVNTSLIYSQLNIGEENSIGDLLGKLTLEQTHSSNRLLEISSNTSCILKQLNWSTDFSFASQIKQSNEKAYEINTDLTSEVSSIKLQLDYVLENLIEHKSTSEVKEVMSGLQKDKVQRSLDSISEQLSKLKDVMRNIEINTV
jgi:hypothetical protein